MRLDLRTDKSVRKALKIELKHLWPSAGRFNTIPSVVTHDPGASGRCFTGNRVFHSPEVPT